MPGIETSAADKLNRVAVLGRTFPTILNGAEGIDDLYKKHYETLSTSLPLNLPRIRVAEGT